MFLCYMTSMKYLMFYDIYNMKLSVVIYPYPAFSLANAPPIASQSLGTNSILKLKYFRISLYSIISLIFRMFYDIKHCQRHNGPEG